MRKILSVILILALGWLAKLSYDMFQISQQLPVLQQNLLKLDQNNAKLNDQLVALQRQIVTAPEQHSPSSAPVTNAAFTANPVVLIKQQLSLSNLHCNNNNIRWQLKSSMNWINL